MEYASGLAQKYKKIRGKEKGRATFFKAALS